MTEAKVLATWSFGRLAAEAAWRVVTSGGCAVDAVEAGTNVAENDPTIDSVGLGGLPDANGEVTLDAAIMESPSRWGSVVAVRRCRNPVSIARRLMTRFGRGMRVGEGAEEFARSEGFVEESPLSAAAREWWQKQRVLPPTQLDFVDTQDGRWFGTVGEETYHDTIGTVAMDTEGRLAAATSTSGLPMKPAGRVGDSALPGHGLWVVPGLAAAACTGTGELITSGALAARTVSRYQESGDLLGSIRSGLEFLENSCSPRERDQAAIVVLCASGEFAAGALRSGFRYVMWSSTGDELRGPEVLMRQQ